MACCCPEVIWEISTRLDTVCQTRHRPKGLSKQHMYMYRHPPRPCEPLPCLTPPCVVGEERADNPLSSAQMED